MAVTTQKSAQIQDSERQPSRYVDTPDWYGRIRRSIGEFTQATEAGDAGSLAELVVLPAGEYRLYLEESRVGHSALGAARTMDIGHGGYTQPDGTVVAADPNAFSDGNDVAAAGAFAPVGVAGGAEMVRISSRTSITLLAQVNDGTLDVGETIEAYFCYASD